MLKVSRVILSLPTGADFATVSRGEHQATAIHLPPYSEGIICFFFSVIYLSQRILNCILYEFLLYWPKKFTKFKLETGKTHLKFSKKKFLQQPELKLNPLDSIVSMSNSYLFINAAPRCYTFTVGRNVVGFFVFFLLCEPRTNLHFRTLCLFLADLRRPGLRRRVTARPFLECFGKKRQPRNTQRNDNSCE